MVDVKGKLNEKAVVRDWDFVKDLSSLGSPFKGRVVFVSEDLEVNEPIEKVYRFKCGQLKELIIKPLKKVRVKG